MLSEIPKWNFKNNQTWLSVFDVSRYNKDPQGLVDGSDALANKKELVISNLPLTEKYINYLFENRNSWQTKNYYFRFIY